MPATMPLRSSKNRWSTVSISLHWLMALLIAALFMLGWMASTWHLSPLKLKLFVWHKSLGLVVLGLVLVRIFWRLIAARPAWPSAMSMLERKLASIAHGLLYLLMVAMPLSGWLINSAANIPFRMFGLVRIPQLVAADESMRALAETAHLALFWLFVAVLVLHIAAALKHHFVDKDEVLRAMLPTFGNH